ncbi:integrase [Bifidobacterium pseudolongum subsp. globosum]|uniref:hypothetical protein n=1 Tax=Bifidobacterium pseudolongum TaxID=1694 RepID=UPI0010EA2DE9|nr:hypothetical protein [Bifidobacterium pseudolongum]RYQ43825.1 integrase [Bifidobacterium pseudolongum subsp. globosum]
MYSTEQRKLAIETYIKFDLSAADTVAGLRLPTLTAHPASGGRSLLCLHRH